MTQNQRKNLEAWIRDLRTTDKPQAQCYLHGPDGYCCLGRACEIMGIPSELLLNGVWSFMFPFANWVSSSSPNVVWFWETFGIDGPARAITRLARLNDNEGYTFAQIADVLEQDYLNAGENA